MSAQIATKTGMEAISGAALLNKSKRQIKAIRLYISLNLISHKVGMQMMTLSFQNLDVSIFRHAIISFFSKVKLSAWDDIKPQTHTISKVDESDQSYKEARKIEVDKKEMYEDWDDEL